MNIDKLATADIEVRDGKVRASDVERAAQILADGAKVIELSGSQVYGVDDGDTTEYSGHVDIKVGDEFLPEKELIMMSDRSEHWLLEPFEIALKHLGIDDLDVYLGQEKSEELYAEVESADIGDVIKITINPDKTCTFETTESHPENSSHIDDEDSEEEDEDN